MLVALALWREREAVLRRPIVLLVGLLALVALGLLFGGAVVELFERVFLLADPYRGLASGGSGRVLIWSYFIELWKQSPVVGVGPSAVVSVGGQQFYSHNLFIDILVEVGVLGLAGFLAFLGLALKAATAPHVSPMLRRPS